MTCPACGANMTPSWGKKMWTCQCGLEYTYSDWLKEKAQNSEGNGENDEEEDSSIQ